MGTCYIGSPLIEPSNEDQDYDRLVVLSRPPKNMICFRRSCDPQIHAVLDHKEGREEFFVMRELLQGCSEVHFRT
eukprot:745984-Hanusia_phi.AAC.1